MVNGYRQQNADLVARSYAANYEKLLRYISQRVNDVADAENIAQDVWLKLLECEKELNEETLLSFLYTIARNQVNDYLRHANPETFEPSMKERVRVECLPPQRRIIYMMSRYDEKSVEEISDALNLSTRTVENHLRLGRRDIRSFVSAIA